MDGMARGCVCSRQARLQAEVWLLERYAALPRMPLFSGCDLQRDALQVTALPCRAGNGVLYTHSQSTRTYMHSRLGRVLYDHLDNEDQNADFNWDTTHSTSSRLVIARPNLLAGITRKSPVRPNLLVL